MRTGHLIVSVASACLIATTASAAEPQPKKFIADAIKGDNSEVMLGQLAMRSGGSQQVRDFGKTLHDDHGKAHADAVKVAKSMGVPDTKEMMPAARPEAAKLEKLKGAAFDREFARYMVADHKKDIAEFEKVAAQGGPAGEHAKRVLPDLRKHLAEAERLSSAK